MRRGWIVTLFLCAVVLSAGCKSNNETKIIGRWKATSFDNLPESMTKGRVHSVLQFFDDGTMRWFVRTPAKYFEVEGTYRLGNGDTVYFNLNKPIEGRKRHVETIQIAGNQLTMIDSDGTLMTFDRQ